MPPTSSSVDHRAALTTPDGSVLRPATLVYKGLHQGDHQPWAYQMTTTIAPAERAGRAIWRVTLDDPTSQPAPEAVSVQADVDQRTLALIHYEAHFFGETTVRLEHAPGQTTGTIENKGTSKEVAYRHNEPREPVVIEETLGLFLGSLALAPGFETRIAFLNIYNLSQTGRYETRLFTVRVEREDVVKVPAGELPVFVVAIDPTDGDERNKATYHVLKTRPHYPVRMEYVVNPKTTGKQKRSVGVEELVSSSIQP